MEPQISDTKAKPMRYAGLLSFLEKFIFVPNQSNQVWRLRLLIMAVAVLIMAVAVEASSRSLKNSSLCLMNQTQVPLVSHLKDFCYPQFPGSLKVNFSGLKHNTVKEECVVVKVARGVDLTLGPNRSDPIQWSLFNFSGSVFTQSGSHIQVSPPSRTNHQISLPEHNTCASESIDPIRRLLWSNFSESGFTESGSHIQGSPPSRTNHQTSLPEQNTGAGESVIGIVLGPNRSDPVWQLRLLAAFSLVVHATMGVLFLPRDLQGVPATYRRVMLITSFAAPIVIAVITLLISLWVEPGRDGHSNWITGLSVANFSTLGGRLAVYWAFKRET